RLPAAEVDADSAPSLMLAANIASPPTPDTVSGMCRLRCSPRELDRRGPPPPRAAAPSRAGSPAPRHASATLPAAEGAAARAWRRPRILRAPPRLQPPIPR